MTRAPNLLLPAICLAATLVQPAPVFCQATAAPQGQTQAPPSPVTIQERVEVVASRLPETVGEVPRAVAVVTGEELQSRGVSTLAGALALVPGVSVAPGGDGGPASSVPEFMGLREFDAFLLLVDGVPWGGAFNPALATLSLQDVERIEILRGPAPVTYGSTSFVGVINVVHRASGGPRIAAAASAGSFGSGSGSLSANLPMGGWASRLTVDGERRGYRDDRTSFAQGHARWMASRTLDSGRLWFAVDGAFVNQEPASPHPREGRTLSTRVPVDANHNPDGAFFDDHRFGGYFGLERGTGRRVWSTTASLSGGTQDILRGFLLDVAEGPGNARGYREQITLLDLYADSHWTWTFDNGARVLAGGDYLHGNGSAKGAIFDYTAPLVGQPAPSAEVPGSLDLKAEDRRDFIGAYVSTVWDVTPAFRVDAGIRLSITAEERDEGEEAGKPAGADAGLQTHVRPGGSVGFTWTPWRRAENRLHLFASYSNTFKPAAVDFGLGEDESEAPLEPETSQLVEGGVKTLLWRGRVSLEASAFLMDFNNLVVATTVGGVPGLTNAGQQRYKGFEASGHLTLPHHVSLQASGSYHDARFRDYVAEFDGVPTQLAGNRIEMSPHALAAFGLVYGPPEGLVGSIESQYVGSRYLNKRNSALADSYRTLGGSVGYASGRWDVRLVAANLTDARPAVSESELGDAQYYRLPARRFDVLFSIHY